jgi:hypothetical protein
MKEVIMSIFSQDDQRIQTVQNPECLPQIGETLNFPFVGISQSATVDDIEKIYKKAGVSVSVYLDRTADQLEGDE